MTNPNASPVRPPFDLLAESYDGLSGWCNHRPLLACALLSTSGPILEFGAGDGSTPLLARYAAASGRRLVTFESDRGYFERFAGLASPIHRLVHDPRWELADALYENPAGVAADLGFPLLPASVALIDHAPSERRVVDIVGLAPHVDYLVVHDSEPSSAHYRLAEVRASFPHWWDYTAAGAWASVCSRRRSLDPVLALLRGVEPGRFVAP